jgi:hypothetical protein
MMVAFFLSGVLVLATSLRELLRRIACYHRFERTEGLVVGIRTKTLRRTGRGRSRPTLMHLPVIAFTKPSGEKVTFTSEIGDSGPRSGYARGQRLEILYDTEGEIPPMLNTWAGVWLPNLMAVLAGGVFMAGAFTIYWVFWEKIVGAERG